LKPREAPFGGREASTCRGELGMNVSGVEVDHFWESIPKHGWTFPMQCVEPAGS